MARKTEKERVTPLQVLLGEWFDWGRSEKAPRVPLTENERVLGDLQSFSVPKFLSALHILKKTEPILPGFREGVEAIEALLRSELLSECNKDLGEDESISVRWHEEKWVIVAIPIEQYSGVLQAS